MSRTSRFALALDQSSVLALGGVAASEENTQSRLPKTYKSNPARDAAPRNAPRAAPDGGLGMALLGARVNAAGGLVSSVGAVSSASFSSSGFTGSYEVILDRNVTLCIYSAAPSDLNDAISVTIQPRDFNPNGVFLRFRDSTNNALVNAEFYLTVYCGR